ncbi:conserved domain protein [Cyanobium sp. PCC 7001]|uniref:DUF1830 domain-containing protein n=1 Tax=Cyanobium sp. PCC 7001 TaxID=180281 RepID=UPI00018053F9|nr:DUF1830 domain-containing protein [Cyanobium sp. PCC 7001]EDY39242.1 conserved domain protein [Cyanobium sp. PCC 7001]
MDVQLRILAMLNCGYRNERSHLVILCCSVEEGVVLERVIFPFELLTFLAPPGAEVLIYGPSGDEPILLETVAASSLRLGLDTEDDHPLLPASMAAMLQDFRHRYSREPTAENRHRLTQLERRLRHGLSA